MLFCVMSMLVVPIIVRIVGIANARKITTIPSTTMISDSVKPLWRLLTKCLLLTSSLCLSLQLFGMSSFLITV